MVTSLKNFEGIVFYFNIFLDDVDAEADEVINELNLLTEGEDANMTENRKQDSEWDQVGEYINRKLQIYHNKCMQQK